MGLLALLLSLVLDAFAPRSAARLRSRLDRGQGSAHDGAAAEAATWHAHPLTPIARWLIDRFGQPPAPAVPGAAATPAGPTSATPGPQLSWAGWAGVIGVPALGVLLVEWAAGAIFSPLILVLHVLVLSMTVTLGPFYRRFSALRLLIGAGETASADVLIRQWEARTAVQAGAGDVLAAGAAGAPGGEPGSDAGGDTEAGGDVGGEAGGAATMPGLERRAIAQSLLVSYRDVVAPLFWYLVLPGAIGAIIVHFARQAALRSGGVSATAFAVIDWIPLRLLGVVFALVGKFEETIDALRAVSPIAQRADHDRDPWAHQRLFLLPVAGAALGLAVADAATEAELRHAAPDLELPVTEPEAGALKPASALLVRSAGVLLGLYVLVLVLD